MKYLIQIDVNINSLRYRWGDTTSSDEDLIKTDLEESDIKYPEYCIIDIQRSDLCYFCRKPVYCSVNNYDEIYFICDGCFANKKSEWEKLKEAWSFSDYGYEER